MACCVPKSASILGEHSHDTTNINNLLIMSSQPPKLSASKITTTNHKSIPQDFFISAENVVLEYEMSSPLPIANNRTDQNPSIAQEPSSFYKNQNDASLYSLSKILNAESAILDSNKRKYITELPSHDQDAELTTEQIENVLDEVQLPSTLMFAPTVHSPKHSEVEIMVPYVVKMSHSFEEHQADVDHTSLSSTKKSKTQESLPASPFYPSLPRHQARLTTTLSSSSLDSECHSNSTNPNNTSFGRWTRVEHQAFLQGLKEFGREWKKVAQNIPTRSSAQIRSHAQKYFAKLAKDDEQQKEHEKIAHPMGNSQESSSLVISHDIYSDSSLDSTSLTPSVLQRVEKILQDPHGAQLEVENTLRLLKERYVILQTKLYQDQLTTNREKQQMSASAFDLYSSMNKFPSTNTSPHSTPIKVSAERIALHKKELIALHVLGGELYRSGSRENLEGEYQKKGNTPLPKHHSDTDSRDSSIEE